MRRFLTDILCTLLLFTVICTTIEPLFSSADNDYSFKYGQLVDRSDKIKYLLLGNSLFANSFNPHVLGDSTLCVASQSRTLNYDAALLRNHIENLTNIEAVLIPMSGHLFAIGKDNDDYVRFCHRRYFHLAAEGKIYDNSALFTGQMRLGLLNSKHDCDSAGYSPVHRTWDGLCHPFVHPKTATTLSNRPHYARYLTEIAALCHENDVRLIVVTPPATRIYEERLSDSIMAAMRAVVASVSAHYPICYHCYHGDKQFTADSLYSDDLHLNHTGATLFAQRVKEDFGL